MTNNRGQMFTRVLENDPICDICGNARSTRKHAKCSKIRQKRHAADHMEIQENENPLPLP
jgi:hypothetical protein